ncbi:hypothetical protein EON76_04765 [bacterium]|nr:MAG: hypothetical protein EON76_04765 [bacterium]
MRKMYMTNPVTWFSIPSNNPEATSKFYQHVFNWNILPETRESNPDFDYFVALNSPSDNMAVSDERGRINGCIVKRATGIEHPAILIDVDDFDLAKAKIIENGGTIVSEIIPMESLNGSFFLAKDPESNLMEVFKTNN